MEMMIELVVVVLMIEMLVVTRMMMMASLMMMMMMMIMMMMTMMMGMYILPSTEGELVGMLFQFLFLYFNCTQKSIPTSFSFGITIGEELGAQFLT